MNRLYAPPELVNTVGVVLLEVVPLSVVPLELSSSRYPNRLNSSYPPGDMGVSTGGLY